MGLSAGRLNRRITFMRMTTVDDGKGALTTSWQPLAKTPTVWAEVIGQNGREAVIEKVLQGIGVFRITIRYRSDILDSDQIRYGDLDLNVLSAIDPDGRREALQITADTTGEKTT